MFRSDRRRPAELSGNVVFPTRLFHVEHERELSFAFVAILSHWGRLMPGVAGLPKRFLLEQWSQQQGGAPMENRGEEPTRWIKVSHPATMGGRMMMGLSHIGQKEESHPSKRGLCGAPGKFQVYEPLFEIKVKGGTLPRTVKSSGSGARTHAPFDMSTILFKSCSTVAFRSSI